MAGDDIYVYMGERLNDLLSSLRLFHLQAKNCDPSYMRNPPLIKHSDSPTPHKPTISLSSSSRRKTTFRSPSSLIRRGKQLPLQYLHLYRPINLQQVHPDPRPVPLYPPSPIRSPRTPSSPIVPLTPPGTLFLQAVHHSPKLKLRTCSLTRPTRVVSEVRREQQAKERRFEAIIEEVKAEFTLTEVQ